MDLPITTARLNPLYLDRDNWGTLDIIGPSHSTIKITLPQPRPPQTLSTKIYIGVCNRIVKCYGSLKTSVNF